MLVVERGTLTKARAGTSQASYTFPNMIVLSNGTLIATCRSGSTKDCADESIEFYRSMDNGHTWDEGVDVFRNISVNGVAGSVKVCYLTELDKGHVIAACMWVDRQTYPEKPLFNAKTEGCLPMKILISESFDFGESWTSMRIVPMPEEIGPPSLTGPILKLANGDLAMSIETNKHYEDSSKWFQKVVLFHSTDGGKSWNDPVCVSEDQSGRVFYWDLRIGVLADGHLAAFSWTYDSELNKYLNIHLRVSADHGRTWGSLNDLGFSDQPAHPAILPDGRVVLAWVDRFGSRSIRIRMSPSIHQPFDSATEVLIYDHGKAPSDTNDTGDMLSDMGLWTFGLPYGELLPEGDILVMYYAGTSELTNIHWARLRA